MHSKPKAHDDDLRVVVLKRRDGSSTLNHQPEKEEQRKTKRVTHPKNISYSLLFHQLSYQGPQTVLRSMCDADDDVLAKRHGGSFLGNKCYYYYYSSELNSKRNLSSPLLIPLILFSVLVKGSSCSFVGSACKERHGMM